MIQTRNHYFLFLVSMYFSLGLELNLHIYKYNQRHWICMELSDFLQSLWTSFITIKAKGKIEGIKYSKKKSFSL